MPSTTQNSSIAGREIVITRLLDAPPAMVFDAWTDPKHLAHWYGPNGFTTTVQKLDLKQGGEWKLAMRGPDGRDYKGNLVFVEVEKPARLVYKHVPEPGGEPVDHVTTVTFEEKEGKTLVTLHQLHSTAEQREFVIKNHNAIEGAKQTLRKLAEYLHMDGAGKEILEDKTVVITRVFHAPRELVFQTWTEPEHLQKWWGPKSFINPECTVDLRIGGKFRIVMQAPDGAKYPAEGVFQEIAPPELLVFTNGAVDMQGNAILEGWTSVSFAEQEGGRTLMTLTTRAIARVPLGKQYIAGMETGWTQSIDKLEGILA